MKIKKYLVALLTLVLLATSVSATSFMAYAASKIEVDYSGEVKDFIVTPGTTTKLSIPVISKSYVNNPVATVSDSSKESVFYISKAKILTKDKYSVSVLAPDQVSYVELEIRTKENAGIGTYPLSLNITGDSLLDYGEISETVEFNVKILEEKAPTQLTVPSVSYHGVMPGKNVDVTFMVRNEGEITARNAYLAIDYADSGLTNGYTATKIKVGDIQPGGEQVLNLPMKVLKTATAGMKTLKVNFSYKDIDGNALTSAYEIQVEVSVNEDAPNLDITNITYKNGLKPGDKFELKADLHNYGEANAKNTTITLTSENTSFIKDYLSDNITANEIKVDKSKTVTIPLLVSKSATDDINALNLEITYEDSNGVVYRKVKTLYLTVVTPEAEKENIIISNVKQTPAQPVAGERMEISFDIENKGSVSIDQIKLSLPNLKGDSFVPVSSEPYVYVNDLKAGSVKRITIPLILSKSIPEGLNNLTLNYEYNGTPTPVQIPVLNVQNDLGSHSKPKLIISKYETDVEEIKAGSVFNFSFEITNTHSSVAAKNITVKVVSSPSGAQTQTEVFTVTQGSNSFFISKIAAGESITKSLELKVKSDAATMAYPIYLLIEYEYDGIEPNPQTGQIGEEQKEELSLQVIENSRPVVDYVSVYSWDGNLTVNTPATISFEFYNMGKSMLNNVIATVEGDFMSTGGDMHFIGNVPAGDRSFAEFEAMPTVEGLAKGTIRITFEDSNGDEVVYTKEFEQYINPPMEWNPDMGGGDIGVFNPMVPEAKKAILPTWLFIIIEVVIFFVFIPITYKIIVSIKRNKLRKLEEANY